MLVEIHSDVVCPWCYLGKRRFERAVSLSTRSDVTVTWRPYQLDPTAPARPVPVREAYEKKFGGADATQRIFDRLTALGASEGLDFRFDDALRVNTFDAHRALTAAEPAGRQNELAESLFRAYFTEGRNIADHAVLAELAGSVGMDPSEVADMLAGPMLVDEVDEELRRARELGITGVPTFVFGGEFAVTGAQDTEFFTRILNRAPDRP